MMRFQKNVLGRNLCIDLDVGLSVCVWLSLGSLN